MALQDLGLGIVFGGAIASSFKTSFKTANNNITDLNSNINHLSKTKLNIKHFKTLAKDGDKNKTTMDKLGLSLKKTGIDVRHIDADSRLLRTSLVQLKRAAKIDIKLTSNKEAFAAQKASIIGIGASLYGVTSVVKSASTVLKAQGEIKSLGIKQEGIDSITQAGQEMALQFGQITAPEFIKAAYDIKSGISSLSDEGVKDFTRFAATTAVATKASVGEMTKLYALGYGIFRQDFQNDNDFGNQFSGAIAGAVQAFRTDGADLSAGLSNIGASAQAMGVSLQEELAIIGVSKSAFNSASEAGSGYRAFLTGVGGAQEKLGLQFTDSMGKMLPMTDILGLINAKYGDLDVAEIGALKTAFGSDEAVKTITALLPKIDQLSTAQFGLEKSMAGGLNKSEEMTNAMDSGYGFEKMSNALSFMSFTIGKAVVPAIDVLASALGGIAKGIAWLDNNIPFLVPLFSGLAMGVMGLVVALKIATLGKLAFQFALLSTRKSILISSAANLYNAMSFNRVGVAALAARGKVLAFAIGTRVATAAQWLLNAALTANPIGLVIAGVAALAAGAVALYQNFAPFTEFVDGLWGKLKGFFSFVLDSWKSVGSIIGKAATWLGFGSDEPSPVKEATRTPMTSGALKKSAGVASALALSSTLAVAQPMPQPVPFPMQVPSTVQPQKLAKHKDGNSRQTFHVNVVVNNPSNNVDVETAIMQAMRKQRAGVSLQDEDI